MTFADLTALVSGTFVPLARAEAEGARVVDIFGEFSAYDFDGELEALRSDWPCRTGRFWLGYTVPVGMAAQLLGVSGDDVSDATAECDPYDSGGDWYMVPAHLVIDVKTGKPFALLSEANFTLVLWPN